MTDAVAGARAGSGRDRPDAPPEFDSRRALSWLLPAGVLVGLSIAALAAFLVVRQAVADQEHRLLRERTNEAALVLQGLIGDVSASMRSLGVAARLGSGAPGGFDQEAAQVVATTPGQSAALVRLRGGAPTVAAAVGPRLAPGDRLTGPRADAVRRAATEHGLVTSRVFSVGRTRLVGLAEGPPVSPAGEVIYLESVVRPAAGAAAAASPESPYHELNLVIYATPRPEPGQAILRTASTPLEGGTATRSFPVGSQRWSLEASARSPLVSSFGEAVPWIILAVGLVSALGAALTVALLVRRRNYALELVDERTAELAASVRELEAAQARLVQQERLAAIGQIAAAVGHELRNPLGVLTNAIYLIRMGVPEADRERMGRHLDVAEREIAASVVIVESLLDFARDRPPVAEPVELAGLVDEALEVAPPPAGVVVERVGLDAAPAAMADRLQLRQVLLNLLTNAYQAIEGEGRVKVAASVRRSRVLIRVSDTGTGMDEETQRQVFDPFFTRRVKGIGLGLAVTKRIVDAHGGAISAVSAPGAGTTFTVELPLAPTPQAVAT
jgi:signal transduction histidine kinase